MKSFISCFILCSLVVLAGCSGDSSSSTSPTPPPGGDVWQITALTPSDSSPLVSTPVSVTATVTLNGAAAPDGTGVEFLANGGVFSNGQTSATVLTAGGQAAIGFNAGVAGAYTIQARVKTVTRQTQVAYRNPDNTGGLQMWSINPAEGSYAGGETVILTGKGIRTPAEVFFTVQGVQYQAIVDQVVPSVPAESAGTIVVRTPEPTAADTTLTSPAEVKVTVAVGMTDEESKSYPAAFTFVGNIEPPVGVPPTPVVFGVSPYYGRSAGGETVTVLGMSFEWDNPNKTIERTFDQVYFLFRGQELLAQVERSSANQIEVITPRFSLTPLTADEIAGIKLTRVGYDAVVKNDVFIVRTDVAQPDITGISPTAGPLDGGTVVTISGHRFQLPLQVMFGDLEATEIQLFDDPSIADNDVITCRTPDYSQQSQVPPVFVAVKVTNLQNGLSDTAAQNFRYGDVLYVGQADPTEGQIGDELALFGSGFEDPLTVFFLGGGVTEFDVLQVTGTQLNLRSPADMAPTCVDRTGGFRVVLNQSNQQAEGGSYTLLGSNPTVTSVDPIFVQETNFGNGVTPSEIDIFGVRFAEELLVRINNYTIDPAYVTVESPELIHVDQIPAPNDFGLVFASNPCTTTNGLQGIRKAPTPVDVTVRNLPLNCSSTLSQTLVYLPEDTTCVAAPELTVNPLIFPPTQFPGPSPGQSVIINNGGGGDLAVNTLFLVGDFFFDAGCSSQAAPGFTVPAFTNGYVGPDVYFCPGTDNGETYPGQLNISSNFVTSPFPVNLNGVEAHPILVVAPTTLTFGAAGVQSFTISNTGTGDLTFSINETDPDSIFTLSLTNGAIPAGGPSVQVDVTNSNSPNGTDGSLEIVAGEPDASGSPETVTLDITY
jgi:hypothetical protein